MKMKPRTTTKNVRALLYRRFIGIEKSSTLQYLYKTTTDNQVVQYWMFDSESLSFNEVSTENVPQQSNIINVVSFSSVLQYKDNYFRFNGVEWVKITELGENITLLSAKFGNVARYQTNKYYYAGSFDYVVRGSVDGTTTQIIKGNIIPLTSLNIKHFDDSIKLREDDFVVVDGRLYSVENPSVEHKHQPRDYNVYFATLNSIL